MGRRGIETSGTSRGQFGFGLAGLQSMTKTHNRDARKVFDETAASIRKLVRDLENREKEVNPVTATEIQSIARQLLAHMQEILDASRSLRDERSEK
jgi:hypothetical protein